MPNIDNRVINLFMDYFIQLLPFVDLFSLFFFTVATIFSVNRPTLPLLNFGFTGAFLGTVVVLILVFAVSLLLLLAIS